VSIGNITREGREPKIDLSSGHGKVGHFEADFPLVPIVGLQGQLYGEGSEFVRGVGVKMRSNLQLLQLLDICQFELCGNISPPHVHLKRR
jgi:hypothetical protein